MYVAAFGCIYRGILQNHPGYEKPHGPSGICLKWCDSLFSIKPYAMKIEADDRVLDGVSLRHGDKLESVGGFRNITGKRSAGGRSF